MYRAQPQNLLYTGVSHDDYVGFKILRITSTAMKLPPDIKITRWNYFFPRK